MPQAGEDRGEVRTEHGPHAGQPKVDQRVRHPAQPEPAEHQQREPGNEDAEEDRRVAPLLGPADHQQHREDAAAEQGGTGVVDPARRRLPRPGHHQHRHRGGHAHEEHPEPERTAQAGVLRHERDDREAEARGHHGGHRESRDRAAHPILGQHIPGDREHQRADGVGQPLEGASGEDSYDAQRQRGDHRAERRETQGDHQDRLAAASHAQPTDERCGHGTDQQRGGQRPLRGAERDRLLGGDQRHQWCAETARHPAEERDQEQSGIDQPLLHSAKPSKCLV